MLHPLLIPNVLESVLEYLPIKDVEKCRLVCVQWNCEGIQALRKRKLIKMSSLRSLTSYTTLFSNSDPHLFPHCCFELHFQFSTNDVPQIYDFFIRFSNNIKLLNLILGMEFFQGEQLSFILEILENLETLQLHFSYSFSPDMDYDHDQMILPALRCIEIDASGYESVTESAHILLRYLFSIAINLDTISYLGADPRRTPSKLKVFLTDAILSAHPSYLRKLAHLRFLMKLNEENLQTLISQEFPLKTVYLDLWNNTEESEDNHYVTSTTLEAFTSRLAPTLIKCAIDFPWRKEMSSSFRFTNPMMRLHSLALNGIEGSLAELLNNLPHLAIFEISQLDLEEAFPRISTNIKPHRCFTQMNKLKLEYCSNQSGVAIRRIARLFPDLKQLEITHIDNNVARAIYKEMPTLLYLYMHGATLSDEGVSGIPEYISQEEKLTENVLSNLPKKDATKLRKYSYIADLKELRRLELDSHLITDIAVIYGIVDCKSLNHLILNYSELTEASITAFENKWGRKRCFESEHRIVI